jgi:hypothetical protein
MEYNIKQFRAEFPDEKTCLQYIFNKKYPSLKGWYPVKGRKCFANAKGKQIHPIAGTIFEKSSTPLTLWFYAIFLFSVSRNGVSAKELQRQLGTTYKTAWRMAKQIRALMVQGNDMLSGTVEVDETYMGGYKKHGFGGKGKTPIIGMVERDGKVKAFRVGDRQTHTVLNRVRNNIARGSHIMSDKFGVYKKTKMLGYEHSAVNHWAKEYVRGKVHTNTIEGFWGQLKRSIDGTYHVVSKKYLQSYVNEFAFRYNHRTSPIFSAMMAKI